MIPALARCAGGEDAGCGTPLEIGAASSVISTGTRAGTISPPISPTEGYEPPVSARDPADRLAGLQGLFDTADLLIGTPPTLTLGAQCTDLHSRRDLKAGLKIKSSRRQLHKAALP